MSETITTEPEVDANGYKLTGGYRVKETNINGRPGVEIIVSPSKRVVTQSLKMSEQFDLFEILSASENALYRAMATLAASVRALGNQAIPAPVAPRFFPKSAADLRAILDDLGDDGVSALLSVQEGASKASADVETIAKN